ncbi:hypothetical protein KCP77_24025 [Salmonella enterica subsp. enterica]|nr:hypothetical protein KCP77_24025 [Salmonella enterica subsp. enterica]
MVLSTVLIRQQGHHARGGEDILDGGSAILLQPEPAVIIKPYGMASYR